eukprot:UN10227
MDTLSNAAKQTNVVDVLINELGDDNIEVADVDDLTDYQCTIDQQTGLCIDTTKGQFADNAAYSQQQQQQNVFIISLVMIIATMFCGW